MCSFKAGDSVVCVDDSPLSWGAKNPLTKGTVYTIERLVPPGGGYFDDGWAVRLVELPWRFESEDQGFLASRFRKVERKSDSLSIESFLTIKPGEFEEPRRVNTPAKRKERA